MYRPPARKTGKLVEEAYRDSARRLSLYWPKEFVTLAEALSGRAGVELYSGDFHSFTRRELERLASIVPKYFWHLVRLPMAFRYEKLASGESRYMVEGGVWQRRLVEMILYGDYSFEGASFLSVAQFKAILRDYKSLVFVSLSV